MDAVKIDDVLRLQDFGLERLDEDEASWVSPSVPKQESPIGWTLPRCALDVDGSGRSRVGLLVHLRSQPRDVLLPRVADRGTVRRFPGGRIRWIMSSIWAEGTCKQSAAIEGLNAGRVFGGMQRMPYTEQRSAMVNLQLHATAEMALSFMTCSSTAAPTRCNP